MEKLQKRNLIWQENYCPKVQFVTKHDHRLMKFGEIYRDLALKFRNLAIHNRI